MEQGFMQALALLGPELSQRALALPEAQRRRTEEFRLRAGRPPTALIGGRERPLREVPVTEAEVRCVAERASAGSYHAVADQLRRGYLTARGGVRVGLCGRAVTEGAVTALRELSSAAIRIPREAQGAGADAIRALGDASALILSPPGGGKTTFLRELVRVKSGGGLRVGLADERGELAAEEGGVPGFDVGPCTDVLTGAPKAEAALWLLRSMNPQAIAMDELADAGDAAAVLTAANAGVRLYATVHAGGPGELADKGFLREVLASGIFRRTVTVRPGERRSYEVAEL